MPFFVVCPLLKSAEHLLYVLSVSSMALKLTVISDQREQLGALSSIVIGVGGGGIGRANDNDWVLPDPLRYLSAHHARIQFKHGNYLLLDTSTNGVYVNEDAAPIGRRGTHQLRHGDILRFGNYLVGVSIDVEPGQDAPEASSIFPVSAQPFTTQPVLGRPDIGASLQVHDLLHGAGTQPASTGSTSSNSRVRPHGAFGQSPLTEDTGLLAFDSGVRSASNNLLTPPNLSRQAKMADRAVDNLAAIEAFCRGAGIDPKQLQLDTPVRVLQLAGVMLREALVGLKGLALSQREMREQAHIAVGKEELQHIGLTGLPVEDLMLRLLLGHESHDLDAVQWVREMLASTRRHDAATVSALNAALTEFISRLEPRSLLQSGARTNGSALTTADWTGLAARFRSITEAPGGSLPHLFVESFARAFVAVYRQNSSDPAKS
jgi:type VI secretion system FHA domain protein